MPTGLLVQARRVFAATDHWIHQRYDALNRAIRLRAYQRGGRQPLTDGYWDYRQDFLTSVLANRDLMNRFEHNQDLPAGYGARLDERVVEYPWMVTRLSDRPTNLLDAGSALNFPFLLNLVRVREKKIVICTLAPENTYPRSNISYLYDDLRRTILRDEVFDEIVCISTLEHIGLDNSFIYTTDQRYNESNPVDYREALIEFRRLLAPNGRLFLTVPYGKYENHGWLQQFDRKLLDDAIRVFAGTVVEQTFFRYTPIGWSRATDAECAECEYYNIHTRADYDSDFAAAARAVACVVLAKV